MNVELCTIYTCMCKYIFIVNVTDKYEVQHTGDKYIL